MAFSLHYWILLFITQCESTSFHLFFIFYFVKAIFRKRAMIVFSNEIEVVEGVR